VKIINLLILSINIIFCATVITKPNLTPSNTIIISDINDVIIQDSLPLLYMVKLKQFLNQHSHTKESQHKIPQKKYATVHGTTLSLLHLGMRKPYIAPYVSWMTEKLGQYNHFIAATEQIYRYLKNTKGYSIVYATNLDRVLYDITALSRGDAFTSLADKVFVAEPQQNPRIILQLQKFAQLPSTPLSYQTLLHKALTIQPTEFILHVPSKKPLYDYYRYVEQKLDTDKNMIFIDDRIENVRGFETLQAQTSANRIGIEFKNPEQLADELIALGILSEIDDKEFLQEIRYPGWWGKITLTGKKMMHYLFSSRKLMIEPSDCQLTKFL
jgi:hypothetical protein